MSVTMWCSTLAPGRDTNVSKRHSRWIRARILFKYATIDHHRAPAACRQPFQRADCVTQALPSWLQCPGALCQSIHIRAELIQI